MKISKEYLNAKIEDIFNHFTKKFNFIDTQTLNALLREVDKYSIDLQNFTYTPNRSPKDYIHTLGEIRIAPGKDNNPVLAISPAFVPREKSTTLFYDPKSQNILQKISKKLKDECITLIPIALHPTENKILISSYEQLQISEKVSFGVEKYMWLDSQNKFDKYFSSYHLLDDLTKNLEKYFREIKKLRTSPNLSAPLHLKGPQITKCITRLISILSSSYSTIFFEKYLLEINYDINLLLVKAGFKAPKRAHYAFASGKPIYQTNLVPEALKSLAFNFKIDISELLTSYKFFETEYVNFKEYRAENKWRPIISIIKAVVKITPLTSLFAIAIQLLVIYFDVGTSGFIFSQIAYNINPSNLIYIAFYPIVINLAMTLFLAIITLSLNFLIFKIPQKTDELIFDAFWKTYNNSLSAKYIWLNTVSKLYVFKPLGNFIDAVLISLPLTLSVSFLAIFLYCAHNPSSNKTALILILLSACVISWLFTAILFIFEVCPSLARFLHDTLLYLKHHPSLSLLFFFILLLLPSASVIWEEKNIPLKSYSYFMTDDRIHSLEYYVLKNWSNSSEILITNHQVITRDRITPQDTAQMPDGTIVGYPSTLTINNNQIPPSNSCKMPKLNSALSPGILYSELIESNCVYQLKNEEFTLVQSFDGALKEEKSSPLLP